MKEHRYPFTSNKTTLPKEVISRKLYNLVKLLVNQDCRVARVLHKAFHVGRYVNPNNPFNFVTFREKHGMISYLPTGKIQAYSDDGKWLRAGRQEVKPAKFLKEFIHPRFLKIFKDHEIAEFATKFKAFEESQMLEFKIVDVATAYNPANFAGQTFGSCMMEKPVAAFYSRFDVKAVMACKKDGTGVGRALLWNSVHFGPVATHSFLDRIYSKNVETKELFIQWAKENGHYLKAEQNNSNFEFLDADGNIVSNGSDAFIKPIDGGSLAGIEYYPYMDTFCSADDDYSLIAGEGGGRFELRNTDGTRDDSDHENLPVEETGENFLGSFVTANITFVDGTSLYVTTFDGTSHLLSDCEYVAGLWYRRDSDLIVSSEYEGRFILRAEATHIEDMNYYVLTRNLVHFYKCETDQKYYRSGSHLVLRNGLYYKAGDANIPPIVDRSIGDNPCDPVGYFDSLYAQLCDNGFISD